jgi:hypothetical protein
MNSNKTLAIASSLMLSQTPDLQANSCNEIFDFNKFTWDVTKIIECDKIGEYEKDITESYDNLKKLQRSSYLIWKIELDNFCNFFELSDCNNPNEFVEKVEKLQWEFWIAKDWIIWPITLKNIYLKHYINNKEKLSHEASKKLKIYIELEWYHDVPWAMNSRLNVFDKKTFYWRNMWQNIPWTYINENLIDSIPFYLEENKNIIKFYNKNWKSVLSFYISWELAIATYVTPGIHNSNPTSRLITNWNREPDLLHVSSTYPKRRNSEWNIVRSWWAVMPYAVHVYKGIRIHWSDWIIDWRPHSHWCIRVWLYYIEHIFELVNILWKENVIIDTKWIY